MLISLLLSIASGPVLPDAGLRKAGAPDTSAPVAAGVEPMSPRTTEPGQKALDGKAPQEEPPATKASAAKAPEALLPGTWLRVRIDVAGFRPASLDAPAMRRRYGSRALLAGPLEPGDTTLALTFETPGREGDGALMRDELLRGDPRGGESFSIGDVACLERVHELEAGIQEARWDAFLVLYSGNVLQLSCSTVTTGTGPRFTRASFEAALASVRAAWLRRGSFGDYPSSLLAVFDELCLGGSRSRRSIEAARVDAAAASEGRAHEHPPVGWEQAFAFGELCAPDDQVRRTYFELARALLEQRAELDGAETLVLAMCEESLGILALRAQDPRAALACFLRAGELAASARAGIRAGIVYNQACAHALLGEPEAALAALERAIGLEARYRELAREDADFAGLRGERSFQELVAHEDR